MKPSNRRERGANSPGFCRKMTNQRKGPMGLFLVALSAFSQPQESMNARRIAAASAELALAGLPGLRLFVLCALDSQYCGSECACVCP
jgi:hypothetical protein